MPDPSPEEVEAAAQAAAAAKSDTEDKTDWKAEARKWEERAKANKPLADKWVDYEQSTKPKEQQQAEEMQKLKAEAAKTQVDFARYKVATANNIPGDYLHLLTGSSEEELLAQATSIAALIGQKDAPRAPAPTTAQGAAESAAAEADPLMTWLSK